MKTIIRARHFVYRITCLFVLLVGNSYAAEPATGTFSVTKNCEAFAGFKSGSNPGQIQVRPGERFTIREVNKKDYEWLRVEMPGATPALRWVAVTCGNASGLQIGLAGASPDQAASKQSTPSSGSSSGPSSGSSSACNIADEFDSYVLAITWQPGFCEYKSGGAQKPECAAMSKGDLVISKLSLHGLWPNKAACGIRYGNCGERSMNLSKETIALIQPWMPNFFYSQSFGKHEWNKHGTCQTAMDSNAYFRKAVRSVQTVNDSVIGQFITTNIGKQISLSALKQRIKTLHPDAPASFSFLCVQNRLYEIRVRLPVEFKEGPGVMDLLGGAPLKGATNERDSCRQDGVYIERSGVN